jgi:hypothetical protein
MGGARSLLLAVRAGVPPAQKGFSAAGFRAWIELALEYAQRHDLPVDPWDLVRWYRNELGQTIWRAHGYTPQERWRRWVLRVADQPGEGSS